MTDNQLKQTLPNDGENIILGLFNCIISFSDFINRFGASILTYDSLAANANTSPAWQQQFEEWKAKGYIS